jgi:hypothetical protein
MGAGAIMNQSQQLANGMFNQMNGLGGIDMNSGQNLPYNMQ